MAYTDVSICNLALLRAAQKQFISSLTADNSPAAKSCALLYAHSVSKCLDDAWWNFATKRAALASNTPDDALPSGYSYSYGLPGDCLRARYLENSGSSEDFYTGIPFKIETALVTAVRTKCIFLTQNSLTKLVYTASGTLVAHFPPAFVEAVAWLLSARLASQLTGQPALAERNLLRYQEALVDARNHNMLERGRILTPEAEVVRARQ